MSVAIAFRFLTGRFHATPWDRHPNEGVPEWPPAPWRVLRAIVASAYRADGAPDGTQVERVVAALAGAPCYWTPSATQAHLRSYQPIPGKTTLVLDPFVAVGGGASDETALLVMGWPDAALAEDDVVALDRWLAALGYLGRAESWVDATRVAWPAASPALVPAEDPDTPDVSLMADTAPSPATARLLSPRAGAAGQELVAALETDTAVMHAQRRLQPPVSRWAMYRWRSAPFASPSVVPHRAGRSLCTPTLVRLALGARVLPRLTDAVRLGDRVRAALMGRSRDADGLPHPLFAGKDADGLPLAGNAHLHVLPMDDDRDGAIDHVLLWAPGGFDERAMRAMDGFTWLWGDEGFDLRVALTGTAVAGDGASALGVPSRWRSAQPVCASTWWRSRTPFVLPRHPKVRRGVLLDGPEDQLRRELERLGLPEPVRVERTDGTDGGTFIPWTRFRLLRTRGGGSRGGDRGYGWRVQFPHPVRGPIAVGYGARQGLGQFEPDQFLGAANDP